MAFSIPNPVPFKAQCAARLLKKYASVDSAAETAVIRFLEDPSCPGDGYRIQTAENEILIRGNSVVAFNGAVGKLLRHSHQPVSDQTVTYNSDFRAVYFANHFYNYYHAAPVEELCDYLESLALWGQNTLALWFDMHHFTSLSAPSAQQMLQKMVRLFEKAKELGMKTSLTHLANEYYTGAPKALLAENSTQSGKYKQKLGGYFYTELCPSNQQGEAFLLTSFAQLLEAFGSVGLDYIMLWPYDQGGCTCDRCYPWGSNGFYNIAKQKAALAKRRFPQIEIIFSCWRFDCFTSGEWEKALARIRTDGAWIDKLMIDIDTEIPGELETIQKPVVSFPEISMHGATPWGGFGANPIPRRLQDWFAQSRNICAGGAIYSEGIFEDINKVVALELMRDPEIDPETVITEYCAYHFGLEYAKALAELVLHLEATLPRRTRLADGSFNNYPSGKPKALHTYILLNTAKVPAIAQTMLEIDKKLPSAVRNNWRYRQIYIRALGDLALLNNNGVPSQESDALYEELEKIYHSQKAYYFLSPVTRKSILENRGEGV